MRVKKEYYVLYLTDPPPLFWCLNAARERERGEREQEKRGARFGGNPITLVTVSTSVRKSEFDPHVALFVRCSRSTVPLPPAATNVRRGSPPVLNALSTPHRFEGRIPGLILTHGVNSAGV